MNTGLSNQELHDAVAVLEKAAQTDPVFLSVEAKAERLVVAQRLRTLTDSICVAAAEAATLGGVAASAKLRTVAQYVAAETDADPAPVRGDVALGGWLRSFPLLEEAFARAELSRSHLKTLKQLHRPKIHAVMVSDQQIFIDAAVTCSYADFVTAAQYWALCSDPDGDLPKEQVRNAGVTVKRRADGMVEGKFVLDPLRGQAFLTAYEREVQKILNDDTDAEIERSNFQRGADALLNLVTAGHDAAGRTKTTPLVNIVVGQKTAEQIIEQLNTSPHGAKDWDLDPNDVDRRCETSLPGPTTRKPSEAICAANGGLPPWHALAAMSVGRFQRHIFKPGGKEIARSTNLRSFTPAQKHILMVQARGRCSTPGCDAPFSWLHADHRHPFSKGGPTAIENGDPKCGPDNRWKTNRTDL